MTTSSAASDENSSKWLVRFSMYTDLVTMNISYSFSALPVLIKIVPWGRPSGGISVVAIFIFGKSLADWWPSHIDKAIRGVIGAEILSPLSTECSDLLIHQRVERGLAGWRGAQQIRKVQILQHKPDLNRYVPSFFLATTNHLYDWFSPPVCLSACPSVTPFWLCSHHRIIMKFSWVITNDKSDVHARGQGQRSKVMIKVTEVMAPFSRFRTVTPVWIHKLRWNDAYSLMLLRRGALMFFKVIRQISRSHGSKNHRIWPRLGISGL